MNASAIDGLKKNLSRIRDRIAAATESAGRSAEDVKLIAVTKYVDAATTRVLVEAGQNVLGESRPQVLWEKAEFLQPLDIEWHLIGHLQRNKVRHTVHCCDWIHSVDSLRLLQSIDAAAGELGRSMNCLLEVNISDESAKHGLAADQLDGVLEAARAMANVRICGLMGMASQSDSETSVRKQFAHLRGLRDQFAGFNSGNIALTQLSMGMSGDFEAAIAEGATMVRIGSDIFAGIIV